MQEINDNYKHMIRGMNLSDGVKKALIDIIDSYTSSDKTKFFDSMILLMSSLSNYKDMQAKSLAYDKICQIQKSYTQDISKIKDAYEIAKRSYKAIDIIPHTSSPSSES